ncbi:MAG: fumarylacetoacetate hydrolase family protein [Bdellovibrionales bacterium]
MSILNNQIRNIWGVGRNYAEHAKELGNTVPSKPLIFLKAGSTALLSDQKFPLPAFTNDVHHEIELAVEFGPSLEIVRAAVCLDLTARDLQAELKKKGEPWTLAKSFKHSTLLGSFFDVKDSACGDLHLELLINDEVRQTGHTAQMIFSVPVLAQYLRECFPICPGDLILTGTPSGVGPLVSGDQIEALCFDSQNKSLSEGRWQILAQSI